MPINRSLYPDNWDEIALSIKRAANWTCEWCGKPCRPPGISQKETEQWLLENHPEWLPHLYDVVDDEELGVKLEKLSRSANELKALLCLLYKHFFTEVNAVPINTGVGTFSSNWD